MTGFFVRILVRALQDYLSESELNGFRKPKMLLIGNRPWPEFNQASNPNCLRE